MSLPNLTVPMSEQTQYPKILVPTGTHFARIFKIIDLGTHQDEYLGTIKGDKRFFSISFEFPKIKHIFKEEKGEQPLARSKDVKFIFTSKESTNRSALTELVEAVGDDPYKGSYNIFSLIGKALQVSIEQYEAKDGKERDKIVGFSKLSSEQLEMAELKPEIYAQINPSQYLYLEAGHFDDEVFNSLPQWIKDKIQESKEFKELFTPKSKIVEQLNKDVELPEISDEELNINLPF